MVWKTVSGGSVGSSEIFGGADLNKVSNLFNGQLNVDSIDINSLWSFENLKLRLNNPSQTAYYALITSAITGIRNITLPLLTGDDIFVFNANTATLTNKSISGATNTITALPKSANPTTTVYTDQSNTYGAFDQIFRNNSLKILNPATTFNYIFATSAILANRTLTLPLLTADDQVTTDNFATTLNNKTIVIGNNNFKILNPAATFNYIFVSSAIAANRNVTLPLLTGNDQFTFDAFATTLTNKTISGSSNTITNVGKSSLPAATVYTDQSNTYGAFDQIYPNSRLKINNPAATFAYTVVSSAITAARNITLPVLTGNDQFTFDAFATTLSNKTLANSTKIANPAATFNYIVTSAAIAADRTVNLPLLTGTDQFTFDAFATTLSNKTLANSTKWQNPAATFNYVVTTSAITADRTATVPLLTGNDQFTFDAFATTLTNKTIDFNSNTITDAYVSPLIKRQGRMVPSGNAQELSGILSTYTITATSVTTTNTFDTTEGQVTSYAGAAVASIAIGLLTPAAAGVGVGRRLFAGRCKVRFKVSTTTNARFFIGYSTVATLPVSDTPVVAADSAAIFGFTSADTNFSLRTSNGTTVTTSTAVGAAGANVAKDANYHTIEFSWTASGNITLTFDGNANTFSTTLPLTTANLNFFCQAQTTASATAVTLLLHGITIEADK